uniref:COesterase domain-containing protein n=1 Tax=Ascaris lumbricoides TaxID=6252 RepID=A0A0M3IAF5_ASCLU
MKALFIELITVSLGSSTLRISLSLLDGALALSFRDDHPSRHHSNKSIGAPKVCSDRTPALAQHRELLYKIAVNNFPIGDVVGYPYYPPNGVNFSAKPSSPVQCFYRVRKEFLRISSADDTLFANVENQSP